MCINITDAMLEEKKKEIEEELIVDVRTTHKTKTKLESAYDPRTSAKSIGIVGVAFLSLVFGCIVMLDLSTLYTYLGTKIEGHQHFLTERQRYNNFSDRGPGLGGGNNDDVRSNIHLGDLRDPLSGYNTSAPPAHTQLVVPSTNTGAGAGSTTHSGQGRGENEAGEKRSDHAHSSLTFPGSP
ncbi:uncharacterized protein LOC118478453 [Aplysia californica]|uniref:Uncharacterized protein LOC118478453 n=1 Tax=Aplysia californica TaxID=6500 RepID=A0ABM1VZW7_APLCA|nr:uncharacterized protein LOC118478453 [Aplysia californica]